MVARLAKKLFGRLGGWIGLQLVQDVPEDIAACEFDCSKPECAGADLINCERRMYTEAAERRVREGESPPTERDAHVSRPAT